MVCHKIQKNSWVGRILTILKKTVLKLYEMSFSEPDLKKYNLTFSCVGLFVAFFYERYKTYFIVIDLERKILKMEMKFQG